MQRRINENSLEAIRDEDVQDSIKGNKLIILNYLQNNGVATNRQIAKGTTLSYNQAQKRTSDLLNEGRVTVAGSIIEGERNNSVYSYESMEIKKSPRRSKYSIFKDIVKSQFPNWFDAIEKRVEMEFKNQ